MTSLSAFLRERFLRDHAHLISPWDCKPSEAVTLTEMLRRRNWLYWEKKRLGRELVKAADHFAARPDEFADLIARRPVDNPPA